LSILVNAPEIQIGEKLSGWVAAHRTPIWNSDATLDLPAEVAQSAGISLGSSVPLLDDEILVGTVTLYSPAGVEIALEQRLLIQAIAPVLAKTLVASIAHSEIAAIDGTNQTRIVRFFTQSWTRCCRAAQTGPIAAIQIRLAIVRVNWHVDPTVASHYVSMHETLERAIAAATNSTGHVIRLGASDILVVASQGHLVTAGLAPMTHSRNPRATDNEVVEIANSLQLREALGLTGVSESQQPSGKPLVH
jgi:hypothetical protein